MLTIAPHADAPYVADEHVICQQTSVPPTGEPSEHDADYDVNGNGENVIPWSVVTGRYRPAKTHNVKSVAAVRNLQETQKSDKKLIGTAHYTNNTIESGVEVIRKSVVHIDNLDANCTPELLKDYLLSRDISVLSCFATKSWMREEERDKVTAYRICVPCEQRDAVMNANIWSKGIVLRDWKFKGKF